MGWVRVGFRVRISIMTRDGAIVLAGAGAGAGAGARSGAGRAGARVGARAGGQGWGTPIA